MKNLIFCENRNMFYLGTNDNGMTLWGKDKKNAIVYTPKCAENTVLGLKGLIIDSDHIKTVSTHYVRFS